MFIECPWIYFYFSIAEYMVPGIKTSVFHTGTKMNSLVSGGSQAINISYYNVVKLHSRKSAIITLQHNSRSKEQQREGDGTFCSKVNPALQRGTNKLKDAIIRPSVWTTEFRHGSSIQWNSERKAVIGRSCGPCVLLMAWQTHYSDAGETFNLRCGFIYFHKTANHLAGRGARAAWAVSADSARASWGIYNGLTC